MPAPLADVGSAEPMMGGSSASAILGSRCGVVDRRAFKVRMPSLSLVPVRLDVVSLLSGRSGMIARHDNPRRAARPPMSCGGGRAAAATPPRPRWGGRIRTIPDRNCFAAIVYMARTSTPWRLLPARELGCASPATVWRRLDEWVKAGVFDQLHLEVLGTSRRRGWSGIAGRLSGRCRGCRATGGGPSVGIGVAAVLCVRAAGVCAHLLQPVLTNWRRAVAATRAAARDRQGKYLPSRKPYATFLMGKYCRGGKRRHHERAGSTR